MGVIGGRVGYGILRRIGPAGGERYCSGSAYQGRSKLESLFGPEIWSAVAGKVVIDFGCGAGTDAIEVAQRGAKKVIGIDIRQKVLDAAQAAAEMAGVSDRCVFAMEADERADVILSMDGFEHYAEPEKILRTMGRLVRPRGRVFIAFGPTWFHPVGGHLFSVVPWAHLLFSEKALIRWRSDFKSDGATRFCEVEGGLNQMTIRRFRKLLAQSDFNVARFEAVPIRRARRLSNRLTREFLTSVVRCTLVPRPSIAPVESASCAGSLASSS